MQLARTRTRTTCTSHYVSLINALVDVMNLFCTAHLFKWGSRLETASLKSSVELRSVLCFHWSNSWNLTEIRCGKGKKNAYRLLPDERMLPFHSKPEFTQCLGQAQPQGGDRGHLNELLLFSSAEISQCCT